MKFGRIAINTIDGKSSRLVAVHPQEERVVDLVTAERLRLERRGAAPEAALRFAATAFPGSLTQAVALGEQLNAMAFEADQQCGSDASLPFKDIEWLPAADPPLIRDAISFRKHLEAYHDAIGHDLSNMHYEVPAYWKGSPTQIFGQDAEIPYPHYTNELDYELEIGFIIGRRGSNLTPEEAKQTIFGLTIFNDYSTRDFQAPEMLMRMGPAKCKEFAFGIGPWVTTIDEFGDLETLEMAARINSEEQSRGKCVGLLWQPEETLAYISLNDELRPGDLIGLGTVGDGSGMEQGRYLEPGDTIELEIANLGTLRQRISAKRSARWMPNPRQR